MPARYGIFSSIMSFFDTHEDKAPSKWWIEKIRNVLSNSNSYYIVSAQYIKLKYNLIYRFAISCMILFSVRMIIIWHRELYRVNQCSKMSIIHVDLARYSSYIIPVDVVSTFKQEYMTFELLKYKLCNFTIHMICIRIISCDLHCENAYLSNLR